MPSPLASASGITATATSTGALRTLTWGDLVVNLYPGTEVEGGPTQLYLRRRDGRTITSTPLLGPGSPGLRRPGDGLVVDGHWDGIDYTVELILAAGAPAWFWHVALTNTGAPAAFDLIHTQDIGLSGLGMLRNNEYYVSQYLDHTALEHPAHGWAVATRNNLGHGGRIPWSVVGSLGRGVGYTTDALTFHGLALRCGELSPGLLAETLPSQRYQHEHALAVIQDETFELGTDASTQRGFFGLLLADHPAATSPTDTSAIDTAVSQPEAAHRVSAGRPDGPGVGGLFATAPALAARELTDEEIARRWGADLRHVETDGGVREAFFTPDDHHVVLRHKDARVLRPHGHMLRTGDNLVPDESQLMSTCYMDGFLSTQLTEGHVGVNKVLSTRRSYLGLQKAAGLRAFLEVEGAWHLLDLPSAFDLSINSATWVYAHAGGTVTITESAATDTPRIDLTITVEGDAARVLLALHTTLASDDGFEAIPARVTVDADGFSVCAPEDSPLGSFRFDVTGGFEVGGDSALFSDGVTRDLPWVTVTLGPTTHAALTITGSLLPRDELAEAAEGILRIAPAGDESAYLDSLLNGLDLKSANDPDIARLGATLPWYVHNALIHYLAPRGLEQYNGGGWGTRDISQGPVELLLALGHHEPIKELLTLVFVAQNDHGGWPQAFGFFERNMFRHADDDPHGDVHFWPPLALAEYILASGDIDILDTEVGYHVAGGGTDSGTMLDHVQRAIGYINERLIPGTWLESYGHGDWNDSLQPADHSMTDTLVSSWTVTLHHQMLVALGKALRLARRDELAAQFDDMAARVLAGFQTIIVDDVLAGYVSYRDPERLSYLVHPRDDRSGLTYSVLPIIHAIINDMLTPEQARAHKRILEEHLVGPDGARLFDIPPIYRGGPQEIFQRAESASFFGREIGIMYMHAHLRYAEAMARYGDADALLLALRQAIPLGYAEAVPNGRPRQSNCYYSSSDAAVTDRYQARAEYSSIMDGSLDVEGGWRIYSSGAGIAVRLITECLLGIRRGRDTTIIDPVLAGHLDGLEVGMSIGGLPVTVAYRVAGAGSGVRSVAVNGQTVDTTALTNPYRAAGVSVATADVVALLTGANDRLTIDVG